MRATILHRAARSILIALACAIPAAARQLPSPSISFLDADSAAVCATDASSPIPTRLAAMEWLSKAGTTPPAIPDLEEMLRHPDSRLRASAARIAIRSIEPETYLEPLLSFLWTHDVRSARAVVDAAARPLPASLAPIVDALLNRVEPGFGWVAADLMAGFEPSHAARMLSEVRPEPQSIPWTHRLAAIERVGQSETAEVIASALTDPEHADEARAALSACVNRLLGQADSDAARAVYDTCLARRPHDLPLLLSWARVTGLYLERGEEALPRLDRELRRRWLDTCPQDARDAAEIELGRSAIRAFQGDVDAGLRHLAAARERLGDPQQNAKPAASTLTRALLLEAIWRIHSGQPDASDDLLDQAISAAPYDAYQGSALDDAFDGPFGPRTVIDLLRRRGFIGTGLQFHVRLQRALARADGMLAVFESRLDAPAPGTNTAASNNERWKSWAPLDRMQLLLHAGRTDEVIRLGESLVDQLASTQVFTNRHLAARALLIIGQSYLLDSDADAAEGAFRRAIAEFNELGRLWLEFDLREQRGHFLPGTPRFTRPLRDRLADAWLGIADVRRILRDDRAGALAATRDAVNSDPYHDRALIALARYLADGEDPARAARVLRSQPRTADRLLPLARLARALGDEATAGELLERHFAWNCLTEERAELERRRCQLDPDL